MNKVIIALYTIFTVSLVSGQNLIKNGDFLRISNNGNKAADWEICPFKLPRGSQIIIDKTNSCIGGQSIRMQNSRPVYIRLDQLHIKVKPHTDYIASFRVKLDDIKKHPGARGVRMFLGRNGILNRAHTQILAKLKPTKAGWNTYAKKINTKDNKELGIALYMNRVTGVAWFDDIQLVEITPDLKQRLHNEKIRRLLETDIDTALKLTKGAKDKSIIKQLKAIAESLPGEKFGKSSDRRLGLPFYPEQKQIYELFGRFLAEKYPSSSLIISSADPFDHCAYLQSDPKLAPSTIKIRGLKNEIEQFALNFSNCRPFIQKVKFRLPGKLNIKVRKVTEVESGPGKTLDDPLRLAQAGGDGEYSIEIPGGMTKQLWFEVKLPAEPGIKEYKLTFKTAKNKPRIFKINLNIMNISFPGQIPIKTFNYASAYRRKLTRKRIPEAAADLKKHHVNAWMNNRAHKLPEPVVKNGKLVPEDMDWTYIDQNIKDFPFRKTFLYYILVRYIKRYDREVLKAWFREIVKGFKKRGFTYENLLITWRDEPGQNSIDIIVKGTKIIKEADPQLRVYSNFHNVLTKNYIKRLAEAVDVIAPEYNVMTPENLKIIKDSGSELWGYRVQNRNIPPQNVRKTFWMLHKIGVKGYSAWCYNYNTSSWNTPKGGSCYNMIYEGDPHELTPTKRWEAWREGIEDYTLLTMLKAQNPNAYQKIIKKYKKENLNVLRGKILDLFHK